jgi:hypothetical protein
MLINRASVDNSIYDYDYVNIIIIIMIIIFVIMQIGWLSVITTLLYEESEDVWHTAYHLGFRRPPQFLCHAF